MEIFVEIKLRLLVKFFESCHFFMAKAYRATSRCIGLYKVL